MEHHVMSGIMLDGNGMALVVTALAGGIVTVGTFAMQVLTFFDNRKRGRERSAEIKVVKDLVNGKSVEHTALVAEKSFEAGRSFQLASPNEPTPPVAVITPEVTAVAPVVVSMKAPDTA